MNKNNQIHARVEKKIKELFRKKAESLNLTETGLIELIAKNDFIFLDKNGKRIVNFLWSHGVADVNKQKSPKSLNGERENKCTTNLSTTSSEEFKTIPKSKSQ